MRDWIRNHGFPLLVIAALVGSGYITASARVPDPVPDYALQAAAVYRLEVGAACFVVAYLAAMAFFLALDGRGFAELGTRGLRPDQVVLSTDEEEETLSRQMMLIRINEENLQNVKAELHHALARLSEQEQRLRRLEKDR